MKSKMTKKSAAFAAAVPLLAALLSSFIFPSRLRAQSTIFSSTAVPSEASSADASAIEVGVKFKSSVNGFIKGIRFYKGSANTGTHIGHLWTASGILLGAVTFTNETASGWQEADFAAPIAITANTVYVASYHTNVGGYARNVDYFTSNTVSNPPLTAPASAQVGGNGVYLYGSGGFPSQSYSGSNYWVDVDFTTTSAPTTAGSTIWSSSATPSQASAGDTSSIEVGVKFKSSVNGFIKGIRFYKGSANTGTHIGHLWTATGTLLGSVTFTNETAAGWQEADFAAPIAISANTVYVASYHTNVGGYARNVDYFTNNTVSNPPLTAPASEQVGGNGVYLYGSGGFPSQSFSGSNYWVDVDFTTNSTQNPAAISIGSSALPDGVVGKTYSATLSVAGGTAPYNWTLASGQLPSGLTLSSNGTISGVPTAEGSYSFTVQVVDSADNRQSQAVSITIASPLSITSTSLPAATLGVSYSASISVSGGVSPFAYKISSGQLPAGLSLSSSGVISGTPATAASYSFTVLVTDAVSEQASRSFTLSVPDPALTSGSGSLQIVTTGLHLGYIEESYQGALTAKGGTAPYAWQISSGALPAGLSINSSTGAISGTPTASGQFSVTVTVSDAAHNSASGTFSIQISDLLLDAYGGFMNITSPEGATGHWRVEKFSNRWLFVTPAGHGFFLTGVWGVSFGDYTGGVDEMGENYYTRIMKKYGSLTNWATQTNSRLKSWGFNTIGPYSHYLTYPTTQNSGWPGGTNPVKMPFVVTESITPYAEEDLNNLASQPTKSIYRGVNPVYYSNGGDFPDVFDSNFDAYVNAQLTTDTNGIVSVENSPWLVGVMIDDTDYLFGFGAGTNFPTEPIDNPAPHLGWITLITAPTQSTNPFTGRAYADTTVYTKLALANFLQSKYGTIQALNAAWGSNYTTFGSSGGWGVGTGLLDENGRHSWVGTDPYGLSNASPAVKADLDAFLYQLASKYYSVMSTRLKQHAPNVLYFGPTTTGGWRSPARAQILQAAGHYVDVLSTSLDPSDPARLSFLEQNLGDKPLIYWEGMYANPDSSRWRYPNQNEGSPYAYLTQSARGQGYATDVFDYANTVATSTGDIPSVGLLYWSWADSLGEELNWGLVSLMDNAYDGKESTISGGTPGVVGSAACADPWGYPCGAEEHNYGDFIDSVRSANLNALETASGH